MAVYKGSKRLVKVTSKNRVAKRIYNGSQLVFGTKVSKTLTYTSSGSITIPTSQNYRITVVAGGGGGATASGGGSGLFIGDIKLSKGTVLSITVGSGSLGGNRNVWANNGNPSSIAGLVSIPGGGGGGGDSQRNIGVGHSAGGAAATVIGAFYNIVKNASGNGGDGWVVGGHGGYSLVDGTLTGPGAGGSGTNQSTTILGATGQSGWVEIRTI